ncbi:hypothetical protein ACFFJT_14255 [Dyella flava]|uniref:DUF2383 domain-containing protein n=1 Tax=Dyella flava TaxID=1920170 RepID=A0ABS2K1H2_9GAMM|nr:hypothetical protein [Dyella flava]MBM7125081.1 hypothetical protein [Dyella flava]GLQ51954.1 hypothetical protein GCM10010872_34030 [Dyella flava]
MNIHDSDIGILNTLISATADSAEAYRAAADGADGHALRTGFATINAIALMPATRKAAVGRVAGLASS